MARPFAYIILWTGVSAGTLAQTATSPESRIIVELRGAGLAPRELEMMAIGEDRYLPSAEAFPALGIKSDYDSVENRITGFFKDADNSYTIDLKDRRASIAKVSLDLTDKQYISRTGRSYFSLGFFKDFFDIDLTYLPRKLQVTVKNALELPSVYAGRRIKAIENRIKISKKLPETELYLGRDFSLIGGGLINWSTNDIFSRFTRPTLRNNLNIGVKSLGGDFTGRITESDIRGRTNTTFRGNFRYPFFDNSGLRQIVFGDIISLGVISTDVTGVEFTNRPPAPRRLFTREVFRGNVDPQMEIAFLGTVGETMLQTADESGAFSFDAPILYGNGLLELHAYDVWGQERVLRYRLNVPYTLIPPGQAEYSIVMGKNRHNPNSPFISTNSVNWGVSPELSIGSVLAYYDFPTGQRLFPGLTSTARIMTNLVGNATFIPDALGSGSLSLEFPSTARLGVTDIRYSGTSFANPTGIVNDLNISALLPIPTWRNVFYFNMLAIQTVFGDHRSDELQTSLTTTFATFTPSISSRFVTTKAYGDGSTTLTEQYAAGLSFLMPAGVHMLTNLSYDNVSASFQELNILGVKRFENGVSFAFTYDRNYLTNAYQTGIRLTYYFPFARTQAGGVTTGPNQFLYTTSAFGSISFNTAPLNVRFSDARGSLLGNGGFTVSAYLDSNGNGRRDRDEQSLDVGRVYYSNLTVGGFPYSLSLAKQIRNKIYSYENYRIFLDPETLENPLWVPRYKSIQVFSEPNLVRRIDFPVVMGGIVRGTVSLAGKVPIPAEHITVKITQARPASEAGLPAFIKTASTFSTGEFEFLGVPPGHYLLSLDPAQLADLQYISEPPEREFDVVSKPEGDIISGLDFTLASKK